MVEKVKLQRADYGLDEEDLKFKKTATDSPSEFDVRGTFEEYKKNPIDFVLASWFKEYSKNELFAYEQFLQLENTMMKFHDEVEGTWFYEDMDIIKLVKTMLIQYKNWATSLRKNGLLSLETMKEVKKVNGEYYMSIEEFEDRIAEFEISLEDIEKKYKK